MYRSKLTRRTAFTTPPKAHKKSRDKATPITPTDNVKAILLSLLSSITDNSSKTMTSTEQEHKSKGKENQAFYDILYASIVETTNDDVESTKTFKKAVLDSVFIQNLKANKNSKAAKLLQTAIKAVVSEMNINDKRFASASDLKAELFNQPRTAAIRTATRAHQQHTVLHPERIKTHFAFHHLTPAQT
jgi:hypothetical protein